MKLDIGGHLVLNNGCPVAQFHRFGIAREYVDFLTHKYKGTTFSIINQDDFSQYRIEEQEIEKRKSRVRKKETL